MEKNLGLFGLKKVGFRVGYQVVTNRPESGYINREKDKDAKARLN